MAGIFGFLQQSDPGELPGLRNTGVVPGKFLQFPEKFAERRAVFVDQIRNAVNTRRSFVAFFADDLREFTIRDKA